MFEVILPNRDRAEAETPQEILFASACLIREADAHGCASVFQRRGVIVSEDGIYNGSLTEEARRGITR